MTSTTILLSFSPLAPFGVHEFVSLHALCLAIRRFHSMRLDGERSCVYDNSIGVVHFCLSAVQLSIRYIEVFVTLSFGVTSALVSTCILVAVQKKEYMCIVWCLL